MSALALTNVVTISVAANGAGVGEYNTSNVGLFTRDDPGAWSNAVSYPLGALVSEGGLVYESLIANNVNHDPSTSPTQWKVLVFRAYVDAPSVAADWGSASAVALMAAAIFAQKPNILAGNGQLIVMPFLAAETYNAAVLRTKDLVQYFAVLAAEITSQVNMLAAAATIQGLNKIALFMSRTAADVAPGGMLDLLRSGGYTQSRGLYYGGATDQDALNMAAAYTGRAFSVDFQGSLTTITMHLKDLATIQPDPSMTQTLLNQCQAAGADVYASFQGVAKTFCSGANEFFDRVYNLQWFVGAIQVAEFNALAQIPTKIPQTEDGMRILKSADRGVCEQAVTNQYCAPGEWDGITFGNQADFLANIRQRGYYIFSVPLSQQSPAQRAARNAPLIQIALKEAGAAHKSNVIVNINP